MLVPVRPLAACSDDEAPAGSLLPVHKKKKQRGDDDGAPAAKRQKSAAKAAAAAAEAGSSEDEEMEEGGTPGSGSEGEEEVRRQGSREGAGLGPGLGLGCSQRAVQQLLWPAQAALRRMPPQGISHGATLLASCLHRRRHRLQSCMPVSIATLCPPLPPPPLLQEVLPYELSDEDDDGVGSAPDFDRSGG